ncbi:MAG: hypothetical protein RDV48_24595 [Candidatus Eremiobacteraeota bacterium]|nr:hypothetical protein [Candidatus Eremiobacteraeota bacterium]
MEWTGIALCTLLLLGLLAFSGCSTLTGRGALPSQKPPVATEAPSPAGSPRHTPAEAGPSMSRAEIEKRLKKLAEDPAPTNLAQGAMCYAAGPRPGKVESEYVCPVCGHRTLYSNNFSVGDIPSCRRLSGELGSLPVKLDESEFCKACRPQVKEPRLGIIIQYPGEEPVRVWTVYEDDFLLLQQFSEGKDRYKDGGDWEQSLKDKVPRLKYLLDIK